MDLNTVSNDINTAVNTGKVVAKFVSNTSLTRLAKDSIFQFPVIVSASIDNDEIFVMAKSLERSYASMMVSVISMSNYIDLRKYGKEDYLIKFLRRFHSNANIGGDVVTESIQITEANILPQENVVGVDIASLWDSAIEAVDHESINDMYLPYTRTKRILEGALEAGSKPGSTFTIKDKNGNEVVRIENADAIAKMGSPRMTTTTTDAHGNKHINPTRVASNKALPANQIVKSDYMTDMAPTMINITVVADATGNGDTWNQTVTIGIKAMVRMVKSAVMINNMIDAFKDRTLFRWISWTNGEISTAELLFGVNSALKSGFSAGKGDNWLKTLRNRKMMQGINKVLGKRLLPNASIIITEAEAVTLQQTLGVDPHNPADVQKMMAKYFLLAFGIYDTENKLLDIMYDGESQFSSESIRELAAKNKKDTNLLAMNGY